MADPTTIKTEIPSKNIAETLAAELPKPQVMGTDSTVTEQAARTHVALPKNWTLAVIDSESLLSNPRRTHATATMGDDESFVAYVVRNAKPHSMVWCEFDPTKSVLHFTAVFDEHGASVPGWRSHQAKFQPRQSAEWITWNQHNKQVKGQTAFAEFIEQNEQDVIALDGSPSSLQMMKMATEFEARQDQRIKSAMRLQSGGIKLEFVASDDTATIEAMSVFERFTIGVPVFWSTPKPEQKTPAYPVRARLRYRVNQGAVTFWYELIRPDLVHQAASLALIARVREGIGGTPLVMGSCI